MGFVSYSTFMNKTLEEPGVPLSSVLRVGDVVEFDIVDSFIKDVPPIALGKSIVQAGEAYVYAKDDDGNSKPCYVTFSRREDSWVFCGACFEKSVMNRCEDFNFAVPTVGQYCVSEYYNEYIRAAEKYCLDSKRGADVSALSVVDDYMCLNAFTIAGYYIDTYGDKAVDAYKENWNDHQHEELFVPALKLLEQKNKLFESIVWNKREMQELRSPAKVDDLIASASSRAGGAHQGALCKADVDFDK